MPGTRAPLGLGRLARAEWRAVVALAALLVAAGGAALLAAYLLGAALVAGAEGRPWAGHLLAAGMLAVAQAVLTVAHALVGARVAVRITERQRERLVAHVLAVGPEILRADDDAAGRIRVAIADAAPATTRYVVAYLPQLVATVIGTLAAGALLLARVPVAAAVAFAAVAAVPLAQRAWRRRLGRRGAEYWSATAALSHRLEDALRGIDEIVAMSAVERVQTRLAGAADDVRRTAVAGLRTAMSVYALTSTLLGIATVGATVTLAWSAGGTVPAATTLVAWAVLPEAVRPWQAFREAWFQGHSATEAQRQVDRVLSVPVPLADGGAHPVAVRDGSSAPELALEDVTVRLGDEDRRVVALAGLDATFPAGRVTALLGESGAGKSTALSLLMRHRDPDAGRVLLDGVDLRDLPLATVRGLLGWVSQDVVLFAGTVGDNIRLARPGATWPEVAAAAERARLLVPFSAGGLARGLATEVGDSGRLISGGQRQRVAIARALLRDSPVLVLDEPTSALDVDNEGAVMGALHEACRGRTVIVVSHRPDGLLPVDRVVRLDHGRLAPMEAVE